MIRINKIIAYIRDSAEPRSSSDVFNFLHSEKQEVSLVTVKRELSKLEKEGLILSVGAGRSVAYIITTKGRLLSFVDSQAYNAIEPDKRNGMKKFNFDLFKSFDFDLFSNEEKKKLDEATKIYLGRISGQTPILQEKELERFVIELSWKSSRIEGNTYTLLDTERLIREGIPSSGNTKDETTMIINHKEAFKYIYEHKHQFVELTKANINDVHRLLVHDLGISTGLRSHPVGVTGSAYIPLDNRFQIGDALDDLVNTVSSVSDPYAKSLVTLLGLSYIQPFEDGNKRTSRLMANAVLLAHSLAPLSYRSVDENSYREATLVFYELNSLIPFKQLFIEQYDFAARNYLV